MLILGLDLAQSTGWALLDENANLIDSGLISLKIEHDDLNSISKNLKSLTKQIGEVIKKYKPDHVVIEFVFSGKNPKVTAGLNMMRGAVLHAMPSKINTVSDHLSTMRKQVMGKMNAKNRKKQVFLYMVEKFGLQHFKFTKDNDKTDAMLLCLYGINRINSTNA